MMKKIIKNWKYPRWGSRIIEGALDFILPHRCPGCGQIFSVPIHLHPPLLESLFCQICVLSISPVLRPCGRCALPEGDKACASCHTRSISFQSASSPFIYGGQLATAIHRFKYGQASYLSRPLGLLLRRSPILMNPVHPPIDLVVPVPLHPRRLMKRGFNQAALLAIEATKRMGLEVKCCLLRRITDTPTQSNLAPQFREENVRHAFQVSSSRAKGRHILLVDDVMTTGSTVEACAQTLIKAGAISVRVLTLARAVP
jgi:ComF family protein